MQCSQYKLLVRMYYEKNGVSEEICDGTSYTLHIQTCSNHYYPELNACNQYCMQLNQLANMEYCVNVDDEDVYYRINGEIVECPCFNFTQDMVVVDVVKVLKCENTLRIDKQVLDMCGNPIVSDETFEVVVKGESFEQKVALSSRNAYSVTLSGLNNAYYQVSEEVNNQYKTSYEVNGEIKDIGIVKVDGDTEIKVLNTMQPTQYLFRINCWDEKDGMMVKPHASQSYNIKIRISKEVKEYTLDCKNHFAMQLEIASDMLVNVELLDVESVRYEVNGKVMKRSVLIMDQEYELNIIDLTQREIEGYQCSIQAWVNKDEQKMLPSNEDVFSFHIEGHSEKEFYLNKENNFQQSFYQLPQGYYRIVMQSEYDNIRIMVNEEEEEDGYFHVDENKQVDILNSMEERGVYPFTITKRFINGQGDYGEPCMVQVNDKYYSLSAENHYTQVVDLNVGTSYYIKEVDADANVHYVLLGKKYDDALKFVANQQIKEALIIEETQKINYVI